jgi:hypothetical protein
MNRVKRMLRPRGDGFGGVICEAMRKRENDPEKRIRQFDVITGG